jgi:actin-related protein
MSNPVVLDLGSESIKAGFAGQVPDADEPRIITPSLVRMHPRGTNANSNSGGGRVTRVIHRGSVSSLECLDVMLDYLLYDQLGWVRGEEGSALFVEPLFVGKSEQEQLTQMMFEGYNVSGLYLHDAAALSLFAAGKLAGISIDIGHGKVDIAAVSEGVTQAPGATRMSFAGEQLTQLLGRLLAKQQPTGQPQLNHRQLGALKVQCCRAAPSAEALQQLLAHGPQPPQANPDQQQQPDAQQQQQPPDAAQQQQDGSAQLPPLGTPQEYTLPDGTKITVGPEGAQTAEALFCPAQALGAPTPSIIDCIIDCVNELPDAQLRRSALDGVLLSGGGAGIPGVHERLLHDLRAQLPTGLAPKLSFVPEYMLQVSFCGLFTRYHLLSFFSSVFLCILCGILLYVSLALLRETAALGLSVECGTSSLFCCCCCWLLPSPIHRQHRSTLPGWVGPLWPRWLHTTLTL